MASKVKPLDGIRVADFTHAGVGPMATKCLADAGAEVIKVETTTRTEVIRRAYPFKKGVEDPEGSAQFALYNSNKLGITLNLTKPKAVELAKRLVHISDVVAESFTPGVMDRLGLGYSELRKVKGDIVMISMSLAGQTGPHAMYRGHGPVLAGLAGLSELTGWPDRPPMAVGMAYTDYYAPQLWALAIIGALVYRRRTGKGQYIDASDFEAAIDVLDTTLVDFSVNQRVKSRQGNRHPYTAPHGCYPCRGDDRWCVIAVFGMEEWQRFKKALGNPDWSQEDHFSTVAGRLANQDELDEQISRWTQARTTEEIMRTLQEAGVRAGVVQNSSDIHEDPQLRYRGHFWELENDPDKEWFTYEAPGYRLSKVALELRSTAPHLGRDNDYVFCQLLGLSDLEFAELIQEGVIQ